MNLTNIDIYREKFLALLTDSEDFKNTLLSFKDEHIKKNTFDLFKCLNRDCGSAE